MNNGLFLSYRRQDSADACTLIYNQLDARLRWIRVFKDTDEILPGSDFVDAIEGALKQCIVLLAVIGPQWATITTPDGKRRLDNGADFVRLEIETAFEEGVPVVILLVDGATRPKADQLPSTLAPLTTCRAFSVRTDTAFHQDMHQAIKEILNEWPAVGRWYPPYLTIALLSAGGWVYSLIVGAILMNAMVTQNVDFLEIVPQNIDFLEIVLICGVIAGPVGIYIFMYTIFRLRQLGRWDWLASVLFLGAISLGLAYVFFGLFGPLKRRQMT